MEKTFQTQVGNKAVAVSAPVVAQFQFNEPRPDPAWVDYLTQREVTGEQGVVARRIGGIALIVLGLPVGIFGLFCFPGLLFWLLGPAGLAMIGKGILLMYSKRAKKPEDAFSTLFKEAFFNADGGTVSFFPNLFLKPEDIKKRIHDMRPIDGIEVNERELLHFMQSFENMTRASFIQYGGPEMTGCLFGVSVDPLVKVVEVQGVVSNVQGVVNVMRQNNEATQIIKMQITLSVIGIDGAFLPVNLVPRFLGLPTAQVVLDDTATSVPMVATAL